MEQTTSVIATTLERAGEAAGLRTTLGNIRRYIGLTGAPIHDPYRITDEELAAPLWLSVHDPLCALYLAFLYGQVKVERHGRKGAKA